MAGYTEQEILIAIAVLRREIPHLLPEQDARQLEEQLAKVLGGCGEETKESGQKLVEAMEIIQNYPQAQNRLTALLYQQIELRSESHRGVFGDETPPGIGEAVKPGAVWVCPDEPGHFRTRLRFKGQRCPQHNVELVPAESIAKVQEEKK
jgi:hypothetical protein